MAQAIKIMEAWGTTVEISQAMAPTNHQVSNRPIGGSRWNYSHMVSAFSSIYNTFAKFYTHHVMCDPMFDRNGE